jgi:hypothetical protein
MPKNQQPRGRVKIYSISEIADDFSGKSTKVMVKAHFATFDVPPNRWAN